ncbi:Muskelin [Nymphon striatum]|nr:Muskelin [Nymphon striatum]
MSTKRSNEKRKKEEQVVELLLYNSCTNAFRQIHNFSSERIFAPTFEYGGPSARSCHKLCLDDERRHIFTLGRYLDSSMRLPEHLKSDFYIYDIENNKWSLITEDTGAMGGPSLIFDHQMCMDVEKNTIYVFGGRVLTHNQSFNERMLPSEQVCSGLYGYHVPTNAWTKLKPEFSSDKITTSNELRSRIGHSMLFNPRSRLMYIFAGQQYREYLNDFFTYNVDTNEVHIISDGSRKDGNESSYLKINL